MHLEARARPIKGRGVAMPLPAWGRGPSSCRVPRRSASLARPRLFPPGGVAHARAAFHGLVRHSRSESGTSKMARKRAAGRGPRGREARGQKAKGEEKEAGESEAKRDFGGDAEEDPEAGPGAGAGRPAPWRRGGGGCSAPSCATERRYRGKWLCSCLASSREE